MFSGRPCQQQWPLLSALTQKAEPNGLSVAFAHGRNVRDSVNLINEDVGLGGEACSLLWLDADGRMYVVFGRELQGVRTRLVQQSYRVVKSWKPGEVIEAVCAGCISRGCTR